MSLWWVLPHLGLLKPLGALVPPGVGAVEVLGGLSIEGLLLCVTMMPLIA